MIYYKNGQFNKKEEKIIHHILMDIPDIYGDVYITKNNLRLYVKENPDLLFKAVKKGDKIAFSEEDGIIFTLGWSDNFERKYIKILAKNNQSADRLLKILLWNIKSDLYIKIRNNNPIKLILQQNGFTFKGSRGSEILMKRKLII